MKAPRKKSRERKTIVPTAPADSAPERKQILVIDDHPFMRAGLTQLIDRQPDMQSCGEAGSPTEAMQLLARRRPDLILSDITMPGRSGLEFIKDLTATQQGLPILVVSMHDEAIYAERALRAGARGYIMKESGGENLLAAIRKILHGEIYVSARMAAQFLEKVSARRPRNSQSPIEKLSDREFEVFQLIGQGNSTRAIAEQLHLSSKTVDVHRSHIKEKLELNDATELVRYAIRWWETQGTSTG